MTARYLARPGAPPPGTELCRVDEMRETDARGFVFGGGTERFELFIVKRGQHVFGYVNECPHALTPLDTMPDKFLTLDETRILCSTHAALFRIEDGYCTSGPCTGKSLEPVPLEIRGGVIFTSA